MHKQQLYPLTILSGAPLYNNNMKMDKNNGVQNDVTDTVKYSGQIVHWKLCDGLWYSAGIIREHLASQQRLVGTDNYVLLINATDNALLNLECMESLLSFDAGNRKAIAIVTEDNLATFIMVGFYIKMHKPQIPLRLFKTEKIACSWLSEHLGETNEEKRLDQKPGFGLAS